MEKVHDFITDDFLLETVSAERLYHDYAEEQPIIDYHCHLDPDDIAIDRKWKDLTEIWLGGDHYKWRAMRTNGISEEYITGSRSNREKFQKFAETMPYLLRNPIYHWSHLELKRYFNIDGILLNGETAAHVWERANAVLEEQITARKLMTDSNVRIVCTTDDPIDDLKCHKKIKNDNFKIKVLPTWRPDKSMSIDQSWWKDYKNQIAEAADVEISSYGSFLKAIRCRHDYFHDAGCRLSDYGLQTLYVENFVQNEIENIFQKALNGKTLSFNETVQFKSAIMLEFCRMDAEKNWTTQLHIGALRNNNTTYFNLLGPDSGFDSISDSCYADKLVKFMDLLEREGSLPKMIIYNLNPRDNEVIASAIGCFQNGKIAGKIQMGSGWWFMDQKDGMERQIEALSQLGLLSRFIGMLTDSRSFLSYTRHEYFRRILCNIIGSDMEKGYIPRDFKLAGTMIENICYRNAAKYFNFK